MDYRTWDFGQWIVIGLSVLLVVWYVAASYQNRKRGLRIYRWLREGLETFGEISNMRWIGSAGSGGQILIKEPITPFRSIEATFLLESREILPLWIFNLMRGKRDELILKATLRKSPSQDIEIACNGDSEYSKIVALDQKPPYSQTSAIEGFQIAYRGRKKVDQFESLEEFLKQNREMVRRISIQQKKPHLVLRVSLVDVTNTSTIDFFNSIQNWLRNL